MWVSKHHVRIDIASTSQSFVNLILSSGGEPLLPGYSQSRSSPSNPCVLRNVTVVLAKCWKMLHNSRIRALLNNATLTSSISTSLWILSKKQSLFFHCRMLSKILFICLDLVVRMAELELLRPKRLLTWRSNTSSTWTWLRGLTLSFGLGGTTDLYSKRSPPLSH